MCRTLLAGSLSYLCCHALDAIFDCIVPYRLAIRPDSVADDGNTQGARTILTIEALVFLHSLNAVSTAHSAELLGVRMPRAVSDFQKSQVIK